MTTADLQLTTTVAPVAVPVPSGVPREHLVTTLDRGMFVYASCVLCAWDGPGRRAYASADRDAGAHLLT